MLHLGLDNCFFNIKKKTCATVDNAFFNKKKNYNHKLKNLCMNLIKYFENHLISRLMGLGMLQDGLIFFLNKKKKTSRHC